MSKDRELRIKKLTIDCKHFRGIQNKLCAAGVNIRELTGGPNLGWAVRMPCLPSIDKDTITVTCPKFCALTREEAEQQDREDQESMDRHLKVINETHAHARNAGLGKGHGGAGELPCPLKCGGTIHYSVASCNGHIHAACTTAKCVRWME